MTKPSRVSELPVLLLIVVIALLLVSLSACQRAVFPQEPPGSSDSQPTDSGSEPPILSIADASAPESAGTLRLAVTLSSASVKTVTVRYTTESSTAEEGVDYTATEGTLTFVAGVFQQSIAVPIHQDDVDEADWETFTVNLGVAEDATLGDATATATILDDDVTVGVEADALTVVEGDVARFTVSLTGGPSTGQVAIGYQVAGTASAGTDYTMPDGSLTLVAGAAIGTITIHTVADEVLDPGETLQVKLRGASTMPGTAIVNPAKAAAVTTIADADMVEVSVAPPAQEVEEGRDAVLSVTLSGVVAAPVSLRYETLNETAEAGRDYTPAAGALIFAPGQIEQIITIPILPDDLDEADERFAVLLMAVHLPEGVNLGAVEAMIIITDDDDPPVLSVMDDTVVEGEVAEFVVSLDRASARQVTVAYATGDDTAQAVEDYTAVSNATLTFAAGYTEQTVSVTTKEDARNEDREAFTVTLSDPSNATLAAGATTATGTITDDDAPSELSITGAAVSEGEAAEFVVKLSPASGRRVTVAYATSDGTARALEDFAAVSSAVLTFEAGDTEQTIRITTQQDTRNEDQEAFTVRLSRPSNATLAAGATTATATIADDDHPPVLSIAGATVSEGETAEFVVTLNPASGKPVTVAWRTDDGTARAREDYMAVSSTTLTFDAGDTEQTISISTTQDIRNEDQEAFTVTLSNSSNATLAAGATTATGTIADDDALPVLSIAGTTVSEGETAEFVVTLSPASGKPVTVAWRTDDGTARAREDYMAVSSMTLTFDGGDTEQTISIATTQDTRNEDQEAFTVTLNNPSNATLARHAATATGAITDDDEIRDDHGNTRSAATSVQPGTPISGRLETATDVDYFKVAVSSTGTLVAATDEAKAADRQHVEYRDTVVRIEGFGYYSSNADSHDTAEVTVGVPGTYDIFVRVTSAHATYYDLAVWLINPEAPDWSFDIALRYLGTEPTAVQKGTIRAAARVWERVITSGLPDRPVASSDESCEDDDPSLFGVLIDDLLINIRLQAVDGTGGVLATAGPCWIRSADGLPYLGDVLLDTADLASLELHDALGGTAAHEIAHVLGFGLLWDDLLKEPSLGRSGNRVSGQDTHFDGQGAVAKFNDAGGDTYAGAKVPVENDAAEYGIGALDAHWRESVFGAEMMTTSVVVADAAEPLSAVTIASLADLGYEVDYSQAQSYLLPTAVSSRIAGAGAIRLIQLRNDIRRKPIRVGDPPELPIPVIAR